MAADDAARPRAHQFGGGGEILLAQRQEFRAHRAREAGPVEQAEDDGDAEIDQDRAPGHRQGGRQRHPQTAARGRSG